MSGVGIIGMGSWGTTVAHVIGRQGRPVFIWGRDEAIVREINEKRSNRKYARNLEISEWVRATADLKEVVEQSGLLFVAVPSAAFRQVAYEMGNTLSGDQLVVSCTKGIEEKTFRFMTEILKEETGCKKVGALSGPNIAAEILQGDPSGAVIASLYEEVIDRVMEVMGQPRFKIYGNKDVKGVEIGGALKNIIAIASGIATGLKFENNAKSFLMTRGIAEISRFGAFWGASAETFMGLSGIGDLIATCTSSHSRNNTLGRRIALGQSLDAALDEIRMVVEGVSATKAVYELSQKFHILMPITACVYRILFEFASVADALKELMTVRVKYEGEEGRETFSSLKHMLINKYPTPENIL